MSGVWLWQESSEVAQNGSGGAEGATLAFIGENTGGSLELVLAFAWRQLEGPLQCGQLAVEPFLTGLEPLLHQLLQQLQLLVQLGLDVGSEEGDVACGAGKERGCLGLKDCPSLGRQVPNCP